MSSTSDKLGTPGARERWASLMELATCEVFQLMLSSELQPAPGEPDPVQPITSVVALAGELCGSLTLRCEEKTATEMTSKMLAMPADRVGAETADALGEICNMVAGNFKNKISGLGDGCMLSPPTVITGKDSITYSFSAEPEVQVRFVFEGMPLVVSLEIHS